MEWMYSNGLRIGYRPALILWTCCGAWGVDADLLRFGVIAKAPGSCGAPRSTRWDATSSDLRQRALVAEQLRLALGGLI